MGLKVLQVQFGGKKSVDESLISDYWRWLSSLIGPVHKNVVTIIFTVGSSLLIFKRATTNSIMPVTYVIFIIISFPETLLFWNSQREKILSCQSLVAPKVGGSLKRRTYVCCFHGFFSFKIIWAFSNPNEYLQRPKIYVNSFLDFLWTI